MIKWFQYALKLKENLNHYYSRFDTNLDYTNFKKKNWIDQLQISFKSNENYHTKKKFFRKFYNNDLNFYVNYIKKNISKKKKILSIGSGRGVAELKLLEYGYNITLSDLNQPAGFNKLKKIFKKMRFLKLNILNDKHLKKYDVIVCFSLLYAFDEKTIDKFFIKCKKILKQDGEILISPGGSNLNLLKIIYERFYLPIELYLFYLFSFLNNKKFEIIKYQHGYIYSDKDIVNQALKHKFVQKSQIYRGDYISELSRSLIVRKLLSKKILPLHFIKMIGKKMPFVNIFHFKTK